MSCKHTECQYRRGLNSQGSGWYICHYLLDTGKARGCLPKDCTHHLDPQRPPRKNNISFAKIHEDGYEWVSKQYWRK
jgi:hypothetical protein